MEYLRNLFQGFNQTTQSELVTKEDIQGLRDPIQGLRDQITQFNLRMGPNFGKCDMEWIQRLLCRDFDYNIELKTFKTPEFELDIYCEDPFVSGEYTTYLDSDAFDKVAKLIRIKLGSNEQVGMWQTVIYIFLHGRFPKILNRK